MNLSKRTQAILKNFAGINQSIVIKPGNILETVSNTKDILASATIEETFEQTVAFYDVNEFLAVLSVFENPELEFLENCVQISQNRMKQTYYYADPSIITQVPEKGITMPSAEVTAKLTRDDLQSFIKSASLMGSSTLTFTNGNAKVWDPSVPNSNQFVIEDVSEFEQDYELSIAVEKLKMVADDYDIELCAKGLSHFTGSQGIEYFVALQPNGRYGS
jgi:hypothetical protein